MQNKVFLFVHASVIIAVTISEWSHKWFLKQMLFILYSLFLTPWSQDASLFLIFPLVGTAVLPTLYIFIWAQYKKKSYRQ